MNKTAIQKFAMWARTELIAQVSQRAYQYGVTAEGCGEADAETVGGRVLTRDERAQRRELVREVQQKGYSQVLEEVAYTWFNRFIALRFMEVNGYLPTHIRVFSDSAGAFKPEILRSTLHLDLPGLDREKAADYIQESRTEDLYRYLLLTQCNALSEAMPQMFETMGSFTELLLPNNILRPDGILGRMVLDIPEEDWRDQVQIIGWLYQYYNAGLKDETFALLKQNVKITRERLPSATQLFTPDWIVRYLVENSLGRLWLEGHPDEELRSAWRYYLDEAEQTAPVQTQLEQLRAERRALRPQELKVIDPCVGSGHMLVYAFDVLMQIYRSTGVSDRDAVRSILENNLYGLDIDPRAAQLAGFAVMMKARQYDRRILTRGIQPQVRAIVDSGWTGGAYHRDLGNFLLSREHQETLNYLLETFQNAREFGSLLKLEPRDYRGLLEAWNLSASQTAEDVNMVLWYSAVEQVVPALIQQAILLSQPYHVVCTNPPYMALSNADETLQTYLRKHFPDSRSDLFACFIERCGQLTAAHGFQAMITQHAWMFLSSFEKLRGKLQAVDTVSMIHLGPRAFEEIGGEVVQTTGFVLRKSRVQGYRGTYCRLLEPATQQGKEALFLSGENRYRVRQEEFARIPGAPVAYWVPEAYLQVFGRQRMSDFGESCIGMRTGDNERFLRLWHEVDSVSFGRGYPDAGAALRSGKKWFPYCKGGAFRKWYGNHEYVVNWEDDGREIKENTRRVYPRLGENLGWKISNEAFYFRRGLTWSGVGARLFGVRCYPAGMIFDSGANSFFVHDEENYFYFAGLLNCAIMDELIKIINPTINTGCGVIAQLPARLDPQKKAEVERRAQTCLALSRADWDAYETSWDFQRHPLL